MDRDPAARASLQGRQIAYVRDPLDALLLQIQGSGRLRLLDDRDAAGQPRVVRLGYAGSNGLGYVSVGRWLIQQGELPADQVSWPAIKSWAQTHPRRLNELLWANPRVVFFKELPADALQDGDGPIGSMGLPLTAQRSIAVDTRSVPLGTPVWIVSTLPSPSSDSGKTSLPQALQHLVVAQDTGSAITGAVRADYFWGSGADAQQWAGCTRQPLRMWVLWPRSSEPATSTAALP